jgi:hypothetical protein
MVAELIEQNVPGTDEETIFALAFGFGLGLVGLVLVLVWLRSVGLD